MARDPDDHPRFDTPPRTPPTELLLAYAPAGLLALAAAMAWLLAFPPALLAGQVWGAAILIFFAGVTRGLSFFTEGGPRAAQFWIMMLRFFLGLAGLVLPASLGFVALAIGWGSIAVTDPIEARHGGTPRFLAVLRPPQVIVAEVGLIGLWAAAIYAR